MTVCHMTLKNMMLISATEYMSRQLCARSSLGLCVRVCVCVCAGFYPDRIFFLGGGIPPEKCKSPGNLVDHRFFTCLMLAAKL